MGCAESSLGASANWPWHQTSLVGPSLRFLPPATKGLNPLGQWLLSCPMEAWDAVGCAGDKRDGHVAAWGDESVWKKSTRFVVGGSCH